MWSFNSRAQLRLLVANPRPAEGLEQAMTPLNPELLELLARLSRDGDLSSLSSETFEQLLELGLIVPTDQLQPAVHFEPLLNGHWPRLVPLHSRPGPGLRVHPELDFQRSAPPGWPPDLLPPEYVPCWLPLAFPQLNLPFCLDQASLAWLRQVQSGQIPIEALSEPLRELLTSTGMLQSGEQTTPSWSQTCLAARQALQQDGFAILRNLLSPLHAAALRAYIRELSLGGYFEHSDEQVERRHTIFNHPLLTFLHDQIQERLKDIVPEPISPSYSILALYHGGAELRRHIDRVQCAWNVSLMLDAEPESDSEAAWPLYIEQHQPARAARLGIGDLVVYSGTRTPHWRPALPAGHKVAVGLFHFVAPHFKGQRM